MRFKPVIFMVLLCLLPAGVFAQPPALTETYTAPDNSFQLNYPAGWTPSYKADNLGEVTFYPSDRSGNTLEVQIAKTDAQTLDQVIEPMKLQLVVSDAPVEIDVDGKPVLYIEGGRFDTLNAAVLFDNREVAYVTGSYDSDNKENWKQVVLAAAASLVLTGANRVGVAQPTPVPNTSIEPTLAPMTVTKPVLAPITIGGPDISPLTTFNIFAQRQGTPDPAAPPVIAENLLLNRLWSVQTELNVLSDAVFSPDGSLIATGGDKPRADGLHPSRDFHILLLSAVSGQVLKDLAGNEDEITQLAFSPDGQILASASADGTLRLWDVASGTQKSSFSIDTNCPPFCFVQVHNVVFSPDGKTVAFMNNGFKDRGLNTIGILDVASGTEQEVFRLESPTMQVNNLIFAPEGNALLFDATLNPDGRMHTVVNRFDLNTHDVTQVFDTLNDYPFNLFYGADKRVWVATHDEFGGGPTNMWDLGHPSDKPLFTIPVYNNPIDGAPTDAWRMKINPAGTIVAALPRGSEVQLWGVPSGQLLGMLDRHVDSRDDYSEALGFSPDGKRVVSAYLGGTVDLWSLGG